MSKHLVLEFQQRHKLNRRKLRLIVILKSRNHILNYLYYPQMNSRQTIATNLDHRLRRLGQPQSITIQPMASPPLTICIRFMVQPCCNSHFMILVCLIIHVNSFFFVIRVIQVNLLQSLEQLQQNAVNPLLIISWRRPIGIQKQLLLVIVLSNDYRYFLGAKIILKSIESLRRTI